MTIEYLKNAARRSTDDAGDVRATVQAILDDIEAGGDDAARRYAEKFDRYDGNIVLTRDEIDAAAAKVPTKLKDDIRFAWDNVRRFAEVQKSTIRDVEVELLPGLIAGQKAIPCQAAGCYAPGGRYSHIASALMTVTTAKVAGCGHITACSPPRPGIGIAPAIIYTSDLCGADEILALGGVQGIAAMAFGLFGLPKSDILVGPGNQFVAEAKRILFGRVGIDMFAGPTDSLILADSTADAEIVAVDLVSQAEHGYNSPVWLATTDKALAETVMGHRVVRRLLVRQARGDVLEVGDVPHHVTGEGLVGAGSGGYQLEGRSLEEVERDLIAANLKLMEGNREKTARLLGMGERTLYRKIKEYGL